MLSKMRDTLSIARRRLRYLTTAWLPIVNAEKQSKASWAKPIRIFADLPDVYRDFPVA